MANGWGGARPNSGPKKGPDGRAIKAPTKARSQMAGLNADDVERLIQMSQSLSRRSAARKRTLDWCPFQIETDTRFLFPESAMPPKDRRLRMAQDNALVGNNNFAAQAWMAGGLYGNAVSEGLLFLGYPYLSELAQRPEFRLFGEIRAEEMTRQWVEIRGTRDESTKKNKGKEQASNKDDKERTALGLRPRSDKRNREIEDKIKELEDLADEIRLRDWFKTAAAQDSYFGISHLFVETKGVDVENLHDPELKTDIGNGRDKKSLIKFKGKRNFITGLRAIEPLWVYPTTYNAINPLLPSWYDPQVWYVMGTEIHKSRLLTFIGRPVPDILKPAYAFGGLSMTQMAQPYVDIWLRTRESVGELIHAFSVMVLMTDMSTTLMPGGSGGGNGDVLARLMMFLGLRDNQGVFAIDKDREDFKNVSAQIAGLDDLVAQTQEHLFSVGRIPAVKFAGIQPKGLNATSEGELRAFNDTIHGSQEHLFRPNLTTLLDLMQISLWGERDPDITFDFLPLHESTPKEAAEIRQLRAQTDALLIDAGVVSQEEVRRKLSRDPESGFDSLNPDELPSLLEEEEEGLEPPGGRPQPQAQVGEAEQGEDAELEPMAGNPNRVSRETWTGEDDRQSAPISEAPSQIFREDDGIPSEDDYSSPAMLRRHRIITGGGNPDLPPNRGRPNGEVMDSDENLPRGARTTFYLIRHGATALNGEGGTSVDRIRGWIDVGLTKGGKEEARDTADNLEGSPIKAIVASDLRRARETAEIVGNALEVPVSFSPGLRPWNVGKFAGEPSKEAVPTLADYAEFSPKKRVPEGESFDDFAKRAFSTIFKILEKPDHAIVTHHRVERLLQAWIANGCPADLSIDFKIFAKKGEKTGHAEKMTIVIPPGGVQALDES